jgi:hypothetical protein
MRPRKTSRPFQRTEFAGLLFFFCSFLSSLIYFGKFPDPCCEQLQVSINRKFSGGIFCTEKLKKRVGVGFAAAGVLKKPKY